MKNKTIYELGVLAQNGNEMAMLEIIERKKNMIKKYSYGDEDRYQYIILRLIAGIKNYTF
ncbi:MAG: helix-turn-helix domain-containing protein [Clostridia bacterium]|nr:helix-turn-helix domain-containing protein [Clostridia bacterium]